MIGLMEGVILMYQSIQKYRDVPVLFRHAVYMVKNEHGRYRSSIPADQTKWITNDVCWVSWSEIFFKHCQLFHGQQIWDNNRARVKWERFVNFLTWSNLSFLSPNILCVCLYSCCWGFQFRHAYTKDLFTGFFVVRVTVICAQSINLLTMIRLH